jgi:hypothetical protein
MARLIAIGILLFAFTGAARAQEVQAEVPEQPEELTLPPVIAEAPGEVHLEPPPDDREDMLYVEVTSGQSDWRVPDLGSSMRRYEEEIDPNQRIHMNLLPLSDPERQVETLEPVPVVDVLRDVGFIQIFRIDLGKKSVD